MSEGSRSVAASTAEEPAVTANTEVGIVTSSLSAIERMLADPNIDIDRAERLFAFQERLMAKQAEIDFNAAKGRILKKLAGIKIVKNKSVLYDIKDRQGNKTGAQGEAFKYAPLEEIDRHLRPLLSDEDMDLSYSDEPREGGGILIRGRLKHLPGGHYEDSFMPAPLDTSGGKSNVQGVGSTNSFLRRYVACNIFNIVVVGDDDDGTGGPIGEVEIKRIRDLLKRAAAARGLDQAKYETAFLTKIVRAPSVEQIPYRTYPKAVSTLEEQITKEKANADTP